MHQPTMVGAPGNIRKLLTIFVVSALVATACNPADSTGAEDGPADEAPAELAFEATTPTTSPDPTRAGNSQANAGTTDDGFFIPGLADVEVAPPAAALETQPLETSPLETSPPAPSTQAAPGPVTPIAPEPTATPMPRPKKKRAPAANATSAFNGSVPYVWRTLRTGAGGYVTSIEMSDDGRLKLVGTDVYGGYELNGNAWHQVVTASSMPTTSGEPGGGVYAFAASPDNSSRAYMYFNGRVYRSTNGAQSWTATALAAPANANDDATKLFNDKMAVHPTRHGTLLVGVPNDGLHRTTNGGRSFTKANGIPNGGNIGPMAIVFDRNSPNTVYAAVDGRGLYRSTNRGAHFTRVAGGPSRITDTEVASDGTVYVSAWDSRNLAAWKWNGSWTDITAGTNGWGAQSIAVSPSNPDRVFLLAESGDLIHSSNGGSSWTSTNGNKNRIANDVPWLAWTEEDYMSAAELSFDPVDSDKLWFTQGIGVWTTSAASVGTSVTWTSINAGIEELVANDVIAPPGTGRRTLAAWDRPLFSSANSNTYPSVHGPNNKFNNAWDVDWSATNPRYQAALISDRASARGPLNPSYSNDGGQTWQSFPTTPGGFTDGITWGLGGAIAVGDPGNVVIVPAQCTTDCGSRSPYYTTDGGSSWRQTNGLPYDTNLFSWYFLRRMNVAADRVNAGTFYAYHAADGIYRSTDGGANWSNMGPAPAGTGIWNLTLKAVPGRAGHLFLTSGHLDGPGDPFYRSTDGGATWTSIGTNLEEVYTFGFGAPAPGRTYPSIFIAGFLDGRYGIYRSADRGASWTQIGDFPVGTLDRPTSMDANKENFDCVYVGYTGSGWVEGCAS